MFFVFKCSFGFGQRKRVIYLNCVKEMNFLCVYIAILERTFAKKILSKAVKIPINIYSSLLLYTTDRFKCCCDSTNSVFFFTLHPISILRARNSIVFFSLHSAMYVCELFGLLFYSMMVGVCCLNLSIVNGQQQ